MRNPQDIWNSYKDLLKKSYIERRFDAWRDLWANECRFVVTYGRARNDGYEEQEHIGREDIVSFFSGSSGRIEVDFRDDGPVYETKNKPDTFLVISNFIATIIASGYHYENRIVYQVTFDGEGKIRELVEYTDPLRRQAFLRKLGV
jgi:ketosteroid isomerase-like protein